MIIKSVEISWQNYLKMADEADALNTDERFRHLHGTELDEVKAAYPGLALEDDFFTGVDEMISSMIARELPNAQLRVCIRDGWDEPDNLEKMVWELSDIGCSCKQMTDFLLALSKSFPKVRFKATVLDPAEDPLASFDVNDGRIRSVPEAEKSENVSA